MSQDVDTPPHVVEEEDFYSEENDEVILSPQENTWTPSPERVTRASPH